MIRYPSVEAVIRLNATHGGPSAELSDRAAVEAAVARPAAGVADTEFFPTLWEKAAALLAGLARSHGFVNGNKRTAWLATVAFLSLNEAPLRRVHPSVSTALVRAVVAEVLTHDETVEALRDGIGSELAETEAEKAGWARADKTYPVVDHKTLAGGVSIQGPEGMERLDLGFLKLDTLDPGAAPFSSDVPTHRFSFVLILEHVDALIADLRRMRQKIGTPKALPRTSTNLGIRVDDPPGPRRPPRPEPKRLSRSQRKGK